MTPIDREKLCELEALLEKATPHPWRLRNDSPYHSIQGTPHEGERYGDMVTGFTGSIAKPRGYGADNAALIVAAVNALPSLLAQVRALEDKEQAAWRSCVDAMFQSKRLTERATAAEATCAELREALRRIHDHASEANTMPVFMLDVVIERIDGMARSALAERKEA